jgi:hypothetical protein
MCDYGRFSTTFGGALACGPTDWLAGLKIILPQGRQYCTVQDNKRGIDTRTLHMADDNSLT